VTNIRGTARGDLPINCISSAKTRSWATAERTELQLERDQTADRRFDRLRHGAGALVGLDVGGNAAQYAQDEGAGSHGGIGKRHVRRGQADASVKVTA
jgi:hypothetical protein